jgi:hypothetical protein
MDGSSTSSGSPLDADITDTPQHLEGQLVLVTGGLEDGMEDRTVLALKLLTSLLDFQLQWHFEIDCPLNGDPRLLIFRPKGKNRYIEIYPK